MSILVVYYYDDYSFLILPNTPYGSSLTAQSITGYDAVTSGSVKGLEPGEMKEFKYAGGDGVYQQVIMNKLYLEKWYDEETSYSGWMDKGQKGFFMFISNTSLSKNDYYPIVVNFKTAKQSAKIHRLYKKLYSIEKIILFLIV